MLGHTVARVGHLVKLDQAPELLSKERFTNVAVEVDLSRHLVPSANIDIEGEEIPNFWQIFEYEHVHSFYHHCGCVGQQCVFLQ